MAVMLFLFVFVKILPISTENGMILKMKNIKTHLISFDFLHKMHRKLKSYGEWVLIGCKLLV